MFNDFIAYMLIGAIVLACIPVFVEMFNDYFRPNRNKIVD